MIAAGSSIQGDKCKQLPGIAEVRTELRTLRASSNTCSRRHRPPQASNTVLESRILVSALFSAMAADGTSQPATTDSGSASEAPNPREGPSLEDLSPAQMQRLLEAALRRFREVEEPPASASGPPVTAASLLNSSLVPAPTASGKRVRHLRADLCLLTLDVMRGVG